MPDNEKQCPHPSYAIVYEVDDELKEQFQLRCYHCGEELPFFFYSKEEWEEIVKERPEEPSS